MPSGEAYWGNDRYSVVLSWSEDRPVAVTGLHLWGADDQPLPGAHPPLAEDDREALGGYRPSQQQSLVEILAVGHGRARASQRTVETAVGSRLRYQGHGRSGSGRGLWVDQVDDDARVTVRSHLTAMEAAAGWSTVTEVTNTGDRPIVLQAVTSLALRLMRGASSPDVDGLVLYSGASEWLGENRWTAAPLRRGSMVDLGLGLHGQDERGLIQRRARSTWSTGADLPLGVLVDEQTGWAWGWQIEHNGPWSWEVGERRDGVLLALFGPTDDDHQWNLELEPGATFRTVPATFVASDGGLEGVAAELTWHRRGLRTAVGASTRLPVIFNDYMNTVMGDPTTRRLLPLIDAAGEVGAEVFCIDAGWYDDGSDWWDAVGEWVPSTRRFPDGIDQVLEAIRSRGMTPGLWLEPEVVGVRSPVASLLPHDAFLQRTGRRVVEHGRLHLDLRHPAARRHLDEVVDRLVALGVGYFKFDYNITPGAGTDAGGTSPGHGLLEYSRAYLSWLDELLTRHPTLLIENCASGGMRQDYATLARMHIQSTSDQQDGGRYPPIASGALLSVLPEHAGNWSYPQPGMSTEETLFVLATGMLGRMYLSGNLDRMEAAHREMVRVAVEAHRRLLPEIARAVPFWPLGLPGWADPWVALGLHVPGRRDLVTLWRRDGAPAKVSLELPARRGWSVEPDWILPSAGQGWDIAWDPDEAVLTIQVQGAAPAARVLGLPWTNREGQA